MENFRKSRDASGRAAASVRAGKGVKLRVVEGGTPYLEQVQHCTDFLFQMTFPAGTEQEKQNQDLEKRCCSSEETEGRKKEAAERKKKKTGDQF